MPNPHSDIDFVSDLVDVLVANHGVDPERVYAMGYSNGVDSPTIWLAG